MKDEMVQISAPAAIVPAGFFKSVQFDSLNATIEKLGDASHRMGQEEKTAAIQIIDEWEKDVIKRLRDYAYDLNKFVGFFQVDSHEIPGDDHLTLERANDIAEFTETQKLYDDFLAAHRDLNSFKLTKPSRPVEDPDETPAAFVERQIAYEAELARWELQHQRLGRQRNITITAWKKAIRQHDTVRDAVDKAKAFSRNLDKYISQCRSKGQMAKLNVLVSTDQARQSLREMLDFLETL